MNTSIQDELESRIADLENRVARTQSRLEKYQADLDALIRTRDILASDTSSASGKSNTKGVVVKAVREVLQDVDGEFGSKEIHEKIEATRTERDWDRTSVSTALRRLADEGVIVQTEEASGRAPAKFRLATDIKENE